MNDVNIKKVISDLQKQDINIKKLFQDLDLNNEVDKNTREKIYSMYKEIKTLKKNDLKGQKDILAIKENIEKIPEDTRKQIED